MTASEGDKIEVKPTLFVKRLLRIGCTFSQVADILQTIDSTCNHCWNVDVTNNSCPCGNMEQVQDDHNVTPIGQGYLDGVLVSAIPAKSQKSGLLPYLE